MLVGCILGILFSSGMLNAYLIIINGFLKHISKLALGFFIICLLTLSWRNVNMFLWVSVVNEVFSALLILHIIISERSKIKKLFAQKTLVWIGSISYGLYLWHDPVYEIMRELGASKLSISIFGTVITFMIASISYYIVEKPMLSFKNKITDSVRTKVILPNHEKILTGKGKL